MEKNISGNINRFNNFVFVLQKTFLFKTYSQTCLHLYALNLYIYYKYDNGTSDNYLIKYDLEVSKDANQLIKCFNNLTKSYNTLENLIKNLNNTLKIEIIIYVKILIVMVQI